MRPLVVARIKRPRTSSPDFEDSETEGHTSMFSRKLAAFKKMPSLNGTLMRLYFVTLYLAAAVIDLHVLFCAARSQTSGRSSSSIKCVTSDEEDNDAKRPIRRGVLFGYFIRHSLKLLFSQRNLGALPVVPVDPLVQEKMMTSSSPLTPKFRIRGPST